MFQCHFHVNAKDIISVAKVVADLATNIPEPEQPTTDEIRENIDSVYQDAAEVQVRAQDTANIFGTQH